VAEFVVSCVMPAGQEGFCPIDPLAEVTVTKVCFSGNPNCDVGYAPEGSAEMYCYGLVWDPATFSQVAVEATCSYASYLPPAPQITRSDAVVASWGVVACWVAAWGIRHLLGRAAET